MVDSSFSWLGHGVDSVNHIPRVDRIAEEVELERIHEAAQKVP